MIVFRARKKMDMRGKVGLTSVSAADTTGLDITTMVSGLPAVASPARWYAAEGDGAPWVVIEANGVHHVIAECAEHAHAEKIARALNTETG